MEMVVPMVAARCQVLSIHSAYPHESTQYPWQPLASLCTPPPPMRVNQSLARAMCK